jgi:Fic family protein
MDELLTAIAAKKERLGAMRPVSRAALLALRKAYDVDLTYTSNAIEGNTPTLRETAELIEHGFTVGGKPLRDHLEAVDHYNAVLWMREVAAEAAPKMKQPCARTPPAHRLRQSARNGRHLQHPSPPHCRFPGHFSNPVKIP